MVLRILLVVFTAFFSKFSLAHSRWALDGSTPPRTTDTGLKRTSAEPDSCGGAARTNKARQFKPGQQLQVQWQETIDHTGHFEIRFSAANDQNFAQYVLAANIPDNNSDTVKPLTAMISLPNIKCDTCTLQLTQIMDGSTTVYTSCADIQLVDNPLPPPPPTPAPIPAPEPPSTPLPAKKIPSKVQGLKVMKLN
ncbi:MAG: lytic polysaccharide monooxygenase [Proteobacteria bacterium]|nr:lytic polysaccharide monooxygenase [Pseudomonadota bacterium]